MSRFHRWAIRVLVVAVATLLAGCGLTIPSDPDGTLDRVRGGELRVGVSVNPPWTGAGAGRSGTEVDLVREFAERVDAEIAWTEGGEEALAGAMERGELDLIIGGLTAESPWADKVALTAPYTSWTDDQGKTHDQVMAVPMGENAFLFELESFLVGED
jgi:ABC-type amino acid transport substrate-binding protein